MTSLTDNAIFVTLITWNLGLQLQFHMRMMVATDCCTEFWNLELVAANFSSYLKSMLSSDSVMYCMPYCKMWLTSGYFVVYQYFDTWLLIPISVWSLWLWITFSCTCLKMSLIFVSLYVSVCLLAKNAYSDQVVPFVCMCRFVISRCDRCVVVLL